MSDGIRDAEGKRPAWMENQISLTRLHEGDSGCIGWTMEVWSGDGNGLRVSVDAEGQGHYAEIGLVMTREEAHQHDLLDHCTHGDSSAHVNVKSLDPKTSVYLFGGLMPREIMIQFLRRCIAMLEG